MNTEIRKVTVKSMANYPVSLYIEDLKFKRSFENEGETKAIEFETLSEGLSSNGVRTLFEEGILIIENQKDRIDLGLQEGEADEERFKVLNHGQILKLLRVDSTVKLGETLKILPREQILRIADIAIREKITDYERCMLIKKYCGVDVITSVQNGSDDM